MKKKFFTKKVSSIACLSISMKCLIVKYVLFHGEKSMFCVFSASLNKESNIPKMETLAKSNFLFKNDILCKNEFKFYSNSFCYFPQLDRKLKKEVELIHAGHMDSQLKELLADITL